MSKPQFIQTPDGGEMVVIERAEFDRLTEAAMDASDRDAAAEIDRKIAVGEEEAIPAAFADRIIDGENPVRVWREYRGLKVKELAATTKIAPAMLSMIENGKRNATVDNLKALATALRVTADDLI
jgi:DNA-binding Xre family transcriptional regulator